MFQDFHTELTALTARTQKNEVSLKKQFRLSEQQSEDILSFRKRLAKYSDDIGSIKRNKNSSALSNSSSKDELKISQELLAVNDIREKMTKMVH